MNITLTIVAILAILFGTAFLYRGFLETKRKKEQKKLIELVLGGIVIAFFAPGIFLFLVAVAIVLMLFHIL